MLSNQTMRERITKDLENKYRNNISLLNGDFCQTIYKSDPDRDFGHSGGCEHINKKG